MKGNRKDNKAILARLGESRYKVAKNDHDIRGWAVIGKEGDKIGTVFELIIDKSKNKVKYLEVDVTAQAVSGLEDKTILVPIGIVKLHPDNQFAVSNKLHRDLLVRYPSYAGEAITPEMEDQVIAAFEGRDAISSDLPYRDRSSEKESAVHSDIDERKRKELLQQRDDMLKDNEKLLHQLKNREQTIEQLQTELNELRSSYSRENLQHKDLQKELSRLKEERDRANQDKIRAINELGAYQEKEKERTAHMHEQNDKLKRQLDALKEQGIEARVLSEEVDELKEEKAQLQTKKEELQAEMDDQLNDIVFADQQQIDTIKADYENALAETEAEEKNNEEEIVISEFPKKEPDVSISPATHEINPQNKEAERMHRRPRRKKKKHQDQKRQP